jgi:DNA-binding Lrp family transcriptional regulator
MMKAKDLRLIGELRKNGRVTSIKLSRKLGIPSSTVYDKVRNHNPLIRKYTCLLNYGLLGYAIRVFMVFKVNKNTRLDAQQFLEGSNNVNILWKVNSDADYIAECIFVDLIQLEEFRDVLEEEYGASKVRIHYMVEEPKREGFVPQARESNVSYAWGASSSAT